MLAFDGTGTGRLKLTDFRDFMASLKQWQSAFKGQTREKTGILRAERLRDALYDVGFQVHRLAASVRGTPTLTGFVCLLFQVNNEVLFALMMRHMRKDGTLRFGDFVSAVLHLAVAFGNWLAPWFRHCRCSLVVGFVSCCSHFRPARSPAERQCQAHFIRSKILEKYSKLFEIHKQDP